MSQTVTETVAQVETMHMKLQSTQPQATPHPPAGSKPRTKLRLDPQRALEPARKKLSTLESQRIMAVLVESIKRTQLVSIMQYILDNIGRFNVMMGAELTKLLGEHKVIVNTFHEMKAEAENLLAKEEQASLNRRQSEISECDDQDETFSGKNGEIRPDSGSRPSSGGSISSQADAAIHHLHLVAKQIQFSCKNILRAFSNHPSVMDSLLKEYNERSEPSEEMISEMQALKDILMGMLLTTPVEEAERNQYLKEITERERHNAVIIKKLEAELAVAVEDRDGEVKKKNDVIRRLQSDLHQIEKFSEEHIRRTKTEAEKQEAADTKNSEGKRQKLQQELLQLQGQVQNLVQEHRENEQQLRRKKYQIETEVENWVQKYDEDMGAKQDEYEEIDAVYTEEKKQLNELEERFKTLETEYTQIMEERRIAREKREKAEREMQMSVGAATTIQAFWRSFKVRKGLKAKKKKKGGKKKGK